MVRMFMVVLRLRLTTIVNAPPSLTLCDMGVSTPDRASATGVGESGETADCLIATTAKVPDPLSASPAIAVAGDAGCS
jgi:hypothetical protein